MTDEAVFHAISDPTRRALLGRLAHSEASVSTLAQGFPMSQPAISQHLKVLREAGLVEVRKQGRQRFYRASPAPLQQVDAWLAPFRSWWTDRLDGLENVLDALEPVE